MWRLDKDGIDRLGGIAVCIAVASIELDREGGALAEATIHEIEARGDSSLPGVGLRRCE